MNKNYYLSVIFFDISFHEQAPNKQYTVNYTINQKNAFQILPVSAFSK